MKEKYQPSSEELERAENMLTPEQRESSEKQEKEVRRHIEGLIRNGEIGTAYRAMEGFGMKIGEEEVHRLSREACRKLMSEKRSDLALRIMKARDIGTEEERRKVGIQAIEELVQGKFNDSALKMAEELYGKRTPEYESIVQKIKEVKKKQSWELVKDEDGFDILLLKPEANMGDLFEALASGGESPGGGFDLEDRFWSEVHDNFDSSFADMLMNIQNKPESRSMKVANFLEQQGISEADASVDLPIRFAKGKGSLKK